MTTFGVPLVFPADLASKQQGHYMKIQIFPTKGGSTTEQSAQTIFLFVPGGNQNGPLSWPLVHEYDDVKLTKLATGAIGAVTAAIPGGDVLTNLAGKGADAAVAGARIRGLGTINPKIDVLYSNTELRRFQFSFFFAPESSEESSTLKKIIKALRKYSAPELTGLPPMLQGTGIGDVLGQIMGQTGAFTGTSGQGSQLKSGLWFIPPAEFLISFHIISSDLSSSSENQYIPKIGRCILERIDVDFSPGQNEFSTFNDGAPTNVQLTMLFREMRVISQADIESGY